MRLFASCLFSVLSVSLLSVAQGQTAQSQTIVTRTIAGPDGINNPYGITRGPDGALYVCEIGSHRISRVDTHSGARTTVAGTGEKGSAGDGGPATAAQVNEPYELFFDGRKNLYFVDMPSAVVRRVDAKSGLISTVAGTGAVGFSGDGGAATAAQFRQPHSLVPDGEGGILVCDIGNNRIRRIDLRSGLISTWSGSGEKSPTPDGAPVAGTPVNGPRALAADPQGNFYLALREGNAIYRISTGRFERIAGTGAKGYSGDGGPGRDALLSGPKGVAWGPGNLLYIADTENHAIRRLNLSTGVIDTVMGTGQRGDGPDGDPLHCQLARPHGVHVDACGNLWVADSENNRIRLLRPSRYTRANGCPD